MGNTIKVGHIQCPHCDGQFKDPHAANPFIKALATLLKTFYPKLDWSTPQATIHNIAPDVDVNQLAIRLASGIESLKLAEARFHRMEQTLDYIQEQLRGRNELAGSAERSAIDDFLANIDYGTDHGAVDSRNQQLVTIRDIDGFDRGRH